MSDTTINTNMAKTYDMTLHNGTVYRCGVVGPGASDVPRSRGEGHTVVTTSVEKTQARAREVLDGIGGWCAYRVEGWWTYEVCYERGGKGEATSGGKSTVRQFHMVAEGETVEDTGKTDFMLGKDCTLARPFDPLSKESAGTNKATLGYFDGMSEQSTKQRLSGMHGFKGHSKYVWDVCKGGDMCEFEEGWAGYGSAVHGAPREVEVRYGCGPSELPQLVDVQEPSSCRYVFDVRFKGLCEVEGLVGEVVPVRQIECFRVE